MEMRITTTSAEEHEAAKEVLRRVGFEVHESQPVPRTYALTFEAVLTGLEGLRRDLRAAAPTALVNPVETGTGRPG
jgi:hypothetical protein